MIKRTGNLEFTYLQFLVKSAFTTVEAMFMFCFSLANFDYKDCLLSSKYSGDIVRHS